MWTRVFENVAETTEKKAANKALFLAPKLNAMPLPLQRYDEPFYPFSKEIIQATQDIVSVYIFDFASYIATGAAGIVALERAIRYAQAEAICVLHGPFVGTAYTVLADEIGFHIDALTLIRLEDIAFYLEHPPYAPIISHTTIASLEGGGIFSEDNLTLFDHSNKITLKVYGDSFLSRFMSIDFIENIKTNIR